MGFLDSSQKATASDRMKGMGMGAPGEEMGEPMAPPKADPVELAMQIVDLGNQLVDAMAGEEQSEGEPMGAMPPAGPPPMS